MIRRPHSLAGRLHKYSQRAVVGLGFAGVAAVAYIIWTTPEGYTGEIAPPASICIDDSSPWGYPAMTPYSELFEDGKEYGKDGEEIGGDGPDGYYFTPFASGRGPEAYGGRRYFNGAPGNYGGGSGLPHSGKGSGGGCSVSQVDESKSWHLIVIGLFAFAVWRWVSED